MFRQSITKQTNKNLQKIPLSWLGISYLQLNMGPAYVWFVCPMRLHWGKLIFASSWHLETASVLGMGAPVCLLSQHWLGLLLLEPVQALCVLPPSLWAHTDVSPAVSERNCFLDVFHFHYNIPHGLLCLGTQSLAMSSRRRGETMPGDSCDNLILLPAWALFIGWTQVASCHTLSPSR